MSPFWLKPRAEPTNILTLTLRFCPLYLLTVGRLECSWYYAQDYLLDLPVPFIMSNLAFDMAALYSQHDFVPEELLQAWSMLGYPLHAIFEWLFIPVALATAFCTVLGTELTAHVSAIAHISVAEFESIISAPEFLGIPVTPVIRAKLRQVLLSARICVAVVRAPDPPPQPAPSQVVVQAVAPPEVDQTTMVNLNDVVRQGSEMKVPLISNEEFQAARKVYRAKEGDYPEAGEQPTIEQCSAFLALMRKFQKIGVDFAIFVPHGDRFMQKRHFTSRQLDSAGNFTYVEVYGPPNFKEWMLCWRVFTVLCIMFNVVSPGRLRRYADKIASYVNRAPDAWGVIYQADVRTRNEHLPRVYEKAKEKHAEALARGFTTEWNPEKPWEEVMRRIVDDEMVWWYDLIEIPFQSIVPGAAKPAAFVSTDAITRPDHSTKRPYEDTVPHPPAPVIPEGFMLVRKGAAPTRGRSDYNEPPPKRQRTTDGDHPKMRNGVYTTTRNGRPVCEGFNTGNCESCDQWGRCSRDSTSAHQCELCLMVGHGAHQPRLCPKQGGGAAPPGRRGGGGPPPRAPGGGGAERRNAGGRRARGRAGGTRNA